MDAPGYVKPAHEYGQAFPAPDPDDEEKYLTAWAGQGFSQLNEESSL